MPFTSWLNQQLRGTAIQRPMAATHATPLTRAPHFDSFHSPNALGSSHQGFAAPGALDVESPALPQILPDSSLSLFGARAFQWQSQSDGQSLSCTWPSTMLEAENKGPQGKSGFRTKDLGQVWEEEGGALWTEPNSCQPRA